ncbi:MAG: chemotaxis-specific protein-glutamate methyltransferase CheB, partial [Huintestinicola sp.]
LKKQLDGINGVEVAGTAADAYQARDMILALSPDIMVLDVEMPKMNGIAFLKKLLPQYNIPVIVISAMEKYRQDALAAGAAAFREKPRSGDSGAMNAFINGLAADISNICNAAQNTAVQNTAVLSAGPVYSKNGIEIIALGASTGGTDALEAVITKLPEDCPPVVVTQHMPPVFTKMYADRLNKGARLKVVEASDGIRIGKGDCVIAQGGLQMELRRDRLGYFISCYEGEKVSGHCPSVDVLFSSVAKAAGKAAIAAILTGMGCDGANGLLSMKNAGAYTIGQDKETCVVYGMPMEAYKLGAVCEQAPLDKISEIIIRKLSL